MRNQERVADGYFIAVMQNSIDLGRWIQGGRLIAILKVSVAA
jgi:hypothetical protein